MIESKFDIGDFVYTFLPYNVEFDEYLQEEPIDMIATAQIIEIHKKQTHMEYLAEVRCPEVDVPFGFDFNGERFFVKESRCFETWNDCYERIKKIQKFLREIKEEEV